MIKHWLHCLKTLLGTQLRTFFGLSAGAPFGHLDFGQPAVKKTIDWIFSGDVTFGQSELKCFQWRLTKTPFCQSGSNVFWPDGWFLAQSYWNDIQRITCLRDLWNQMRNLVILPRKNKEMLITCLILVQCDQIGQFLKAFGFKFSYKYSPNVLWLLGPFTKMSHF